MSSMAFHGCLPRNIAHAAERRAPRPLVDPQQLVTAKRAEVDLSDLKIPDPRRARPNSVTCTGAVGAQPPRALCW
jgi:hypothetical protein